MSDIKEEETAKFRQLPFTDCELPFTSLIIINDHVLSRIYLSLWDPRL